MKDFTLDIYSRLLKSLLQAGYQFLTFEEWCVRQETVKAIVLRHDVDRKPERSLTMAQLEAGLGIKATYYFRIVPQSNQPNYIQAIARLGHEIGYHYEDFSLADGNSTVAYEKYKANLAYFRTFYPVKTISMHGSSASRYDNRDIWKTYEYHKEGIIGEPYFDFINRNDVLYFTDTGRCWDGDKFNVRDKRLNTVQQSQPKVHTTVQLIKWIENSANQLPVMINTHPQRWTDNKTEWILEYITQNVKNLIKKIIVNRMGK